MFFLLCAGDWTSRRKCIDARDISTLSAFPRGDSTQEPPQEIGAGDDALLLSPDQDQVVVDDIIFSMLRLQLHEPDNVAQSRAHVGDDDRAMPIRLRTDRHFVEEDIAPKMVSVQNHARRSRFVTEDHPLSSRSIKLP